MGAIDQTKDYAEKVIELLMCETLKSKSELCLSFDLPIYWNRIWFTVRTGSKRGPNWKIRWFRFGTFGFSHALQTNDAPIIVLFTDLTERNLWRDSGKKLTENHILNTKRGISIGKDKNRRFKSCLQEGIAVTGGLGLFIPIDLHSNLQLNNSKTTAHRNTKFQVVKFDA